MSLPTNFFIGRSGGGPSLIDLSEFPVATSGSTTVGNVQFTRGAEKNVLWMGITAAGAGSTACFVEQYTSGQTLYAYRTTASGRTLTASGSFYGGTGGMGGNAFVVQVALPLGTTAYRYNSGTRGSPVGTNYQNPRGGDATDAYFEVFDGTNWTTLVSVSGGEGSKPGYVYLSDYRAASATITPGWEDFVFVHSLGSGGRFGTTNPNSAETSAASQLGGTAGGFVDLTNKKAYSAPTGHAVNTGQSYTRTNDQGVQFSGSGFVSSSGVYALISGDGGRSEPNHNNGAGSGGGVPSGGGGGGAFYQPGGIGREGIYSVVAV